MTKDQILEKYGSVKLKFSRYYKYTFTYTGIADNGDKVTAYDGGISSDIYRTEVLPDQEVTLNGLWAECAIIERAGEQIAKYDERC